MSNNEYLQKFLKQLLADKKSERTIETYEQNINKFFKEVNWSNLFTLTREQIEDYKLNSVVDKNLSENSINLVINSLKSFYKFLKERKYIEESPLNNVKSLKIPEREREYMTLEVATEFLNLVKTKNNTNKERNFLMFLLFLYCGLRLSELANLKKDQLDFQNMFVSIVGKGNKQRKIPLNDEIKLAYDDYIAVRNEMKLDSEWLFVNRKGERLSKKRIQGQFDYYIELAQMDSSLHIHSLRHTFASLLIYGGVDILTLQKLMGHSDIKTTTIYTHVNDKKLQDAAMLNPLLKK